MSTEALGSPYDRGLPRALIHLLPGKGQAGQRWPGREKNIPKKFTGEMELVYCVPYERTSHSFG